MTESFPPSEGSRSEGRPRDVGSWAQGRNVLRVSDVPAGADASLRSVIYTLAAQGRRVRGLLRGPIRRQR